MDGTFVTGVDGCRKGWIAATMRADGSGEVVVRVVPDFSDLLVPEVALVAVDMPIGLPDRIEGYGRVAEQAVRPLLGSRRNSVFPMPSRKAVWHLTDWPTGQKAILAAHQEVCSVAETTSLPPARLQIQSFSILPKVRQLDKLLCAFPELAEKVIEVHPEVAFWRMNGETPVLSSKKKPEGIAERRALLMHAGLPAAAIEAAPPRGAATDDLIDALAALTVALRHVRGQTRPFPDPPERDSFGIPVAIWA